MATDLSLYRRNKIAEALQNTAGYDRSDVADPAELRYMLGSDSPDSSSQDQSQSNFQLPKTSGPMSQALLSHIAQGPPRREDYEPGFGGKLAAGLIGAIGSYQTHPQGMGTTSSVDVGRGLAIGSAIKDKGYNEATDRYNKIAAELAKGSEVEGRQLNSQIKYMYDVNSINARNRRTDVMANKADEQATNDLLKTNETMRRHNDLAKSAEERNINSGRNAAANERRATASERQASAAESRAGTYKYKVEHPTVKPVTPKQPSYTDERNARLDATNQVVKANPQFSIFTSKDNPPDMTDPKVRHLKDQFDAEVNRTKDDLIKKKPLKVSAIPPDIPGDVNNRDIELDNSDEEEE